MQKFKHSSKQILEIFEELKENIYITDIPSKIEGMTLPNLTMLLKNFTDGEACEGSTFVSFLYELGYLLQRISCKSFEKFNLTNSQELGFITGNLVTQGRIKNGLIKEGKISKCSVIKGILKLGTIVGPVILRNGKKLSSKKWIRMLEEKIINSGEIRDGEFIRNETNGIIENGLIASGFIRDAKLISGDLYEKDENGILQVKIISGILQSAHLIKGIIKNWLLDDFTLGWFEIEEGGRVYRIEQDNLKNIKLKEET